MKQDQPLLRIIGDDYQREIKQMIAEETYFRYNMRSISEKVQEHLKDLLLQTQSKPQMEIPLEFMVTVTEQDQICKTLNCVDLVFKIIDETENISTLATLMRMVYRLYHLNPVLFGRDQISKLIYLCRIFFDHNNQLTQYKYELYDYFYDDQEYQKLTDQPIQELKFSLEFYVGQLAEPYDQEKQNKLNDYYKLDFPQANYRDYIQNELQIFNACPLIDALRYRMIFYQEYLQNPLQAKQRLIELHFLGLELYLLLDLSNRGESPIQLFEKVFEEKIDYGWLFSVYAKLLHLKSPTPQFHCAIMRYFDGIINIEPIDEQEDCFHIAKEYDETFLQLIYDVLGASKPDMEIENGYPLIHNPQMLSVQVARSEEVAVAIMKLFTSDTGVMLLSKTNIALGASQAILKAITPINGCEFLQSPEIIKAAIRMVTRLSRKEDITRDFNIIDDLLKIGDTYLGLDKCSYATQNGWKQLTSEDIEKLCTAIILSINEHFKDDETRRARIHRANAPTIARKVADTQLYKKIYEYIKQKTFPSVTPLLQQTMQLLSHVADEVPTLIGRIIDAQLPMQIQIILENCKLQDLKQRQVDVIFTYYGNICLKEEGFVQFHQPALKLFDKMLSYVFESYQTEQEVIQGLIISLNKYILSIDKAQKDFCKIIIEAVNRFDAQLQRSRGLLLEQINKNHKKDYHQLLIMIQNFVTFISRLFNSQNAHQYQFLAEINKKGLVERALFTLQFPSFELRNDIVRFFKSLIALDERDSPHKIVNALYKALTDFQKIDVVIDDSYHNSDIFFGQLTDNIQQNAVKFEQIAQFNQITTLLEIFKQTFNNYIKLDKQKVADIMRRLSKLFVQITSVICEGNSEGSPTLELYINKHKMTNLLLLIRQTLIHYITDKHNLLTDDQIAPFVDLLTNMASRLNADSLQQILINSIIIKDFTEYLIPKAVIQNSEFIEKLTESDFFKFLYAGVGNLCKRIKLANQDQELLNQLGLKYAKILQSYYLQRIIYDVNQNKESAYKIFAQFYDDLNAYLVICVDVQNKALQPIIEVLVNKSEIILKTEDIIKDYACQKSNLARQYAYKEDDDSIQDEHMQNTLQQLTQMGFEQSLVQEALNNVLEPDIQSVIDWIDQNRELNKLNVKEKKQTLNEQQVLDYKKILQQKKQQIQEFYNKHLLFFRGYEDQVSKFVEGSNQTQNLMKNLKFIINQTLPKSQKYVPQKTVKLIDQNSTPIQNIKSILHYLIALIKRDKTVDSSVISVELPKIGFEILKLKDDDINIGHSINYILGIFHLSLSDQSKKKIGKKDQQDMYDFAQAAIKSRFTNQTTSKVVLDLLLVLDQCGQFVEAKGIDSLIKVKGAQHDNLNLLTKFALKLIEDDNMERASLECSIKKLFYDEEHNKIVLQLQKTEQQKNEIKQQELLKSEKLEGKESVNIKEHRHSEIKQSESKQTDKCHNYPINYQPLFLQISDKSQYSMKTNHPILQKYANSKQFQYVKSIILEYDEVKTTDPKDQIDTNVTYLKRGFSLNTIDSIPPQYFVKHIEDGEMQSKPKKNSSTKQKNIAPKFQHTQEVQIFIKTIISQIVNNYSSPEGQEQQYAWQTLVQLIHVLIRKYPLLTSKIMQINCSKLMKQHPQKLQQFQQQLNVGNNELPKKISFLTFIIKCLVPTVSDSVKNLLFELCLDNHVLYSQNGNLIPYSYEIRRRILHEFYEQIDERRKDFKANEQELSIYSYTLINLLSIKSVAKMAFRNIDKQWATFNFTKLYVDTIKSIPLQTINNFYAQFQFIIDSMNVIYSLGIFVITQNKPQKLEFKDNITQDIMDQLIPRKTVVYKSANKIFLNWPLPSTEFHNQNYAPEDVWQLQIIRQAQPRGGFRRGRQQQVEVYLNEDANEGEVIIDGDEMMMDSQSLNDQSDQSQQEDDQEEDDQEENSWVTSSSHSYEDQQEEESQHSSSSWTDEEDSVQDANQEGDDQQQGNEIELENGSSQISDEDDIDNEEPENDDEQQIQENQIEEDQQSDLRHPLLEKKVDEPFMSYLRQIITLEGIKLTPEFREIQNRLRIQIENLYKIDKTPNETLSGQWIQDLVSDRMLNTDDRQNKRDPYRALFEHGDNALRRIGQFGQFHPIREEMGFLNQFAFRDEGEEQQDPELDQFVGNVARRFRTNIFDQPLRRHLQDQVNPLQAGDQQQIVDALLNFGQEFMPQRNNHQLFQQRFQRQFEDVIPRQPQQPQLQQFQQPQPQQLQIQNQQLLSEIQNYYQQQVNHQNLEQQLQRDALQNDQQAHIDQFNLFGNQQPQAQQQQVPQIQNQVQQQPVQQVQQPQQQPPQQPQINNDLNFQQPPSRLQQLEQEQQHLLLQQQLLQQQQQQLLLQQQQIQQQQLLQQQQQIQQQQQQVQQQQQQVQQQQPPQQVIQEQAQIAEFTEERAAQLQRYPGVVELLARFGKTLDDLTKNDYDIDVFDGLPEDIKVDIILSLPNPNQIDQEFMRQLPQEMQQELQNQQLNQNALFQQNQNEQLDLVTFIQTLTPDLREEVLLTLPNESLNQLPIELREEAMEIRMRVNTREIYRLERQPHQVQRRGGQQPQNVHPQNKEKQNLVKVKELLLKDKHLNHRLGNIDDEFVESIINLLYLESHRFVQFPLSLFLCLINNPLIEQKIVDHLFFILRVQKNMPAIKRELGLKDEQFPPTYIVGKNSIMKDYSRTYDIVSLKILFLLSKMQFQNNYFFELRKSSLLQKSQQEQIPLFQLIYLLPTFKGNHQDFLIEALSNVTKVKTKGELPIRLDNQCIECMCQTLLQLVQNKSIKAFATVVTNLCSEEQNLQQFLRQIKEFIQSVTKEINQNFQRGATLEETFHSEKSLISIFSFIKELIDREQQQKGEQKEEVIRTQFQELLEDPSLQQLWKNLSEMLADVQTQQIARHSSKIAPYLECFFIIYQMISPQIDIKKRYQRKDKLKIAQMETDEQLEQDNLFQNICERGKVLLNMMIKEKLQEYRQEKNKNFLQEPLGIIFLKAPKIIDFENKQKYFKLELKQLKAQNRPIAHGGIQLRVRRKEVFTDSYMKFQNQPTEKLRGKLTVEFQGEEGVDAGGVTREWFLVLSKEMFNPNYALFTPSLNGQMFQPSNKSHVNPDHVKFFNFIGRIVGKALYDGHLLDAYFTRSFYKHILGKPLTIHDMEDIDQHEYNSMKKILENDVTDWGVYWTYDHDNFGKIEGRELVEGGKTKPVTEENKAEYVQTYCYQKMAKEIKDQIEAFLSGFQELIPQSLISIFEWKEMELLLCGLPDIDLEDMKENCEYHGFNENDTVIQWLWELLESYDKSKRASFLQFITGTSKVPLGGFKELRGIHGPQKIQIHKKPYKNYELPTSHTCFNQLDLPQYPSRQILKEKLELAILEGKEGFGFA